jgi:hypothetical protein
LTPRPISRTLALLIWLSLLPLLLLLGLWMGVDRVRTDQVEMRQAADRRLNNYVGRIDGFIDARIRALSMLAHSPLADNPRRWPDLYAEATAFQESFGSHVIFADSERQMRFNTRVPLGTALPRLPDSPGRTAAQVALATGSPAVGDLVQGPVVNEPLVAMVVPGLRDGAVRHLVLVTTTAREFQQRVDEIAVQPGWALTLADGTGRIIARQAPPGFDPARDVDPEWRFQARSRFAPWTIRLEIPRAVQREALVSSATALAAGIVLATLAGALGGGWFARRIGRQMAMLSDVAAPAEQIDIAEIAAARRRLDAGLADLRASEASHREMFAANPHPMWVYDLETLGFLAVNDAALRHYGHGRDEFLAMTMRDLRLPGDAPLARENAARAGDGQEPAGAGRHRTRDGRLIDVEISSHAVVYAGRSAELVLVHDVTARRRAEDALRQRNEELERLSSAAGGRELAMVELKRQVNALAGELGRAPPYDLSFAGPERPA